jgi:uncharacterized membrane protein YidH (DUF202 family)
MKSIRTAVSIVAVLLLVGGYALSVRASLAGESAEYAAKVDTLPVRNLALVILVASIVLALMREKEEPSP